MSSTNNDLKQPGPPQFAQGGPVRTVEMIQIDNLSKMIEANGLALAALCDSVGALMQALAGDAGEYAEEFNRCVLTLDGVSEVLVP